MTTITKITYPCPDTSMGDTSETECNTYRSWFAAQIVAAYPGADVTVTDSQGRITVETDDDSDDADLIDSLSEFGNRCWDKCPWDWTE